MTPGMVPDRNVGMRQIAGPGNARIARNNNRGFANTVRLSPHHPFFNFRRLVYRPMACAADIAGAFPLASMSFGVTFECAKTVILKRHRHIHAAELGSILAASFDIELVVETFLDKISLLVC